MNTIPKFQIGNKVYKIIIYPSWLNGGVDIKEIEVEAIKIYKNGVYEYFYDINGSFRDEDINKSVFVDKKMATQMLINELENKLKIEKQYVKNLNNYIKKLKKSITKH